MNQLSTILNYVLCNLLVSVIFITVVRVIELGLKRYINERIKWVLHFAIYCDEQQPSIGNEEHSGKSEWAHQGIFKTLKHSEEDPVLGAV